MTSAPERLRTLAIDSLEELKAVDIRPLDVRELTTVTDCMIVASGRSERQVRALAENLIKAAKVAGHPPMGTEGEEDGQWVLVDLGDVVVHIMSPEARELYQLEKLWAEPTRLREMAADMVDDPTDDSTGETEASAG